MRRIVFTGQARADVRCLDIPTAMRLFAALHQFAETGVGDVRKLQGNPADLRLRVGDYRLRFVEEADVIQVKRVLHRSEAYR